VFVLALRHEGVTSAEKLSLISPVQVPDLYRKRQVPQYTIFYQLRSDAANAVRTLQDSPGTRYCLLIGAYNYKKEDSLLAVTASSFVGLNPFQCTRHPVGCKRVLYE
jgi:hypothetical protein